MQKECLGRTESKNKLLVLVEKTAEKPVEKPIENLDDVPEVIEKLDPFLEEAALITQDYIKYGRIAKK